MPLVLPTDVNNYVTLEIKRDKKQREIDAVIYTAPILEPTKDAEIAAKRAEIETYRKNYEKKPTGRAQYKLDVQPLKDALHTLISDNEAIVARNMAKENQTRTDYNNKIAPLQAEIATINQQIRDLVDSLMP